MKKAIIMLLAVLMLISFVSCNDQKVTEEMREQAMKDFVATMSTSKNYMLVMFSEFKYDLSNWNSTTDYYEKYQIEGIIARFVGTNDIISAKGIVELTILSIGDSGEYSYQVIVDGVEISYIEDGEKKNLTLDYDISILTDEEGNGGGTEIVKEFVLNGKTYKPIEWTGKVLSSTMIELSEAKCDGIDLDCEKLEKLISSKMK